MYSCNALALKYQVRRIQKHPISAGQGKKLYECIDHAIVRTIVDVKSKITSRMGKNRFSAIRSRRVVVARRTTL